jgi:nucleotide-binding universal stress UspA family protein
MSKKNTGKMKASKRSAGKPSAGKPSAGKRKSEGGALKGKKLPKSKKSSVSAKPKSSDLSRQIVWAIDPFKASGPSWSKLTSIVKALSLDGKTTIQPVYVLSPSNFNFTGEFSGPWMAVFEPKVREAFTRVLSGLGISSLLEPEIILNKETSMASNVSKLLKFVEKSQAEVLVMNSHARTGLARLFLGSFAETALMTTKVPLILVNPETKSVTQFKKVLFPTDFSASNKKAFKKTLVFCKKYGAQLIIYHKLPDPIEPMVQTGVYMAGGGWVSVQQYIDLESAAREKESQVLVAEAAKMGVDAKFFIEEKPGFITDSINQYISQNSIDLVAVGSKSGPISSVLVGSIGRQMVREASCPVWVVHV